MMPNQPPQHQAPHGYPAYPAYPAYPQAPAPPPRRRRTGVIVGLVLSVVVFVGAVAGLAIFYTSTAGSDDGDTTGSGSPGTSAAWTPAITLPAGCESCLVHDSYLSDGTFVESAVVVARHGGLAVEARYHRGSAPIGQIDQVTTMLATNVIATVLAAQ
ncbi:hypothetical protein [Actinophytocola gossypii]|uniref:Uncharacterized protein n=1 Tax=Actinophytocola gossypii TaxID=2812003 RepID=A0ABT2JES9_9PSEU|nr:hypothetical protein [Actinophytocola gossypii]MCT2586226.1 hypothetical protein [Actinophytocola gossypii]